MTKPRIRAVHVGEIRPFADYRYGELPSASVVLAQLLKDSDLQALFESYYSLIKIPIAIIDLNANVLLSSRWQRICTEFHRVHPDTCARCVECDTTLAVQLKEGQTYTIYPCLNGLTDCASPIVVEGEHVANLFIGQFFTATPDEERFRRQAEEFGFDVNDYLAALREVPIVAADRIPHILDLLNKMTRVVTRLSIERKQAIEHLAEREKAQAQLETVNRLYAVLSATSRDILHPRDGGSFLKAACEIAVERGGFRMAWVGLLGPDGRVVPAASAGAVDGYLDLIAIDMTDATRSIGPTGRALRSREHVICENIETDPLMAPWRDDALRRGYRASAAFPLTVDGEVIGAFTLYASEPGRLADEEEVGLLDALALDIGFALEMDRRQSERRQVESALEQSERRFRTVIEHSMDVTVILDRQGRFAYSNPATLQLLGYQVGELRNQVAFDVVHPADRPRIEAAFARAVGGAAEGREEFRVRQKDGSWRPLDAMFTNALDEPAIQGIVVNARDITERRAAEEAMQKSQALFAKMFAMAPIAISLHDRRRDYRIMDVNAEAERLFGVPRGQLIGHSALELGLFARPDQRAALLAAMEVNGRAEDPRVEMRDPRGRSIIVHMVAQTIELAGEPMMVTAMLDVTRRLETEQQLRESEARFRTAFTALPDALYLATRDEARILEVNPQFGALFGYSREEVLGKTSRELGMWAVPSQRADMLSILRERGVVRSLDVTIRRKDGTTGPALISVAELPDTDPVLILGSLRDMREAHEAAAALRTLEEQFRQAQKLEAVGRLAGGVAHDFNNILTVISSVSDLLLDDLPGDDPHREDVEQVKKSSQKAAALTRQLLAFSRRQVMNPRFVDLNSIVEGLEKMLGRLIGEDIELALELGAGLGAVRIDPSQLEQVILNLVVNARDAMPSGGRVMIETGLVDLSAEFCGQHPGAQPGPHVMLSVSDTGTGMDAATIEHVFEPFFTTKEAGKGTGLGLATVHGIVTQSGGVIVVDSEPGRGSVFTLFLPHIAGAALEEEATAPVREGGSETILLVEDDADVRRIAQRALLAKGYDVIGAPDGAMALAAAKAHSGHISLLLTDLVMPGMSGREVAAALMKERPGLRVLFMSGHTSDEAVRTAVLQNFAPFIQKPFTPQQISAKVREVLDAEVPATQR